MKTYYTKSLITLTLFSLLLIGYFNLPVNNTKDQSIIEKNPYNDKPEIQQKSHSIEFPAAQQQSLLKSTQDNTETTLPHIPKITKPVKLLPSIPFIKNLRNKLDSINGRFNQLDAASAFALGRELYMCTSVPRNDEEKIAYDNSLYFQGDNPEKSYTTGVMYEECKNITDEEIAGAYSLIKKSAEAGNEQAIVKLSDIMPPMPSTFEGNLDLGYYEQTPDIQAILTEHAQEVIPLLEKLASKGYIPAIHNLEYTYSGGTIVPKNMTKGLAYSLVSLALVNNPETVKLMELKIKRMTEQMYDADIEEAKQLALQLSSQLNTLKNLKK